MSNLDTSTLDYSRYKDVTVTYRLYGEQLDSIENLAILNNRTLEKQLDTMMVVGSVYDIQDKIDAWTQLMANQNKRTE